MSWDEAKMLSDVVASNVVPSGFLLKNLGKKGELEVTGNGYASIAAIGTSSSSVDVTIVADGNTANLPISHNNTNVTSGTGTSIIVPFERSIKVSINSGSYDVSTRALVSIILFNRKSIGGGYRVVRLNLRKAVA